MASFIHGIKRTIRREKNRRLAHKGTKEILPARVDVGPKDLILFCSVINGMLFLPSFLKHYRKLGVKLFIMAVDGRSEDDTLEVLSMEPDVTVLTTEEYKGQWPDPEGVREEMLKRYAQGRWCLHVDIDEFFDYPLSSKCPPQQLLHYLDTHGYNAMFCLMLDRFSDEPLCAVPTRPEIDLGVQYPWYDLTNFKWKPYSRRYYCNNEKPHPLLRTPEGGIMYSCFETAPSMMKHPLIKYDRSMALKTHYFTNMHVADLTGVLNHYRFTSDLKRRVDHFLSRNLRSDFTRYGELHRRLETKQSIMLRQPSSRKWTSVDELVDQGVLLDSEAYLSWVNELSVGGSE